MAASDANIPNNPNYVVTIKREGVEIKAGLPESFSFGVNANYEPRLPNSITDIAGQKFGAATIFLPVNKVLQEFSHQAWQSSSPVELNLPLLFDAKSDARVDVLEPIKKLMMMALPSKRSADSLLLDPPGPTLLDPNRGRISLGIGKFIYIHSVLLVDVNPTWDTRMNKAGVPISASCDVTFRTVNTPTQGDIHEFFMSGPDDFYTGYGVVDINSGNYKDKAMSALGEFKDDLDKIGQTLTDPFGDPITTPDASPDDSGSV